MLRRASLTCCITARVLRLDSDDWNQVNEGSAQAVVIAVGSNSQSGVISMLTECGSLPESEEGNSSNGMRSVWCSVLRARLLFSLPIITLHFLPSQEDDTSGRKTGRASW